MVCTRFALRSGELRSASGISILIVRMPLHELRMVSRRASGDSENFWKSSINERLIRDETRCRISEDLARSLEVAASSSWPAMASSSD